VGYLEEFSRSVAAAVSLPVLLYNLPQFTSGLQKETVHTLIMRLDHRPYSPNLEATALMRSVWKLIWCLMLQLR
jgi:hypothetical protein